MNSLGLSNTISMSSIDKPKRVKQKRIDHFFAANPSPPSRSPLKKIRNVQSHVPPVFQISQSFHSDDCENDEVVKKTPDNDKKHKSVMKNSYDRVENFKLSKNLKQKCQDSVMKHSENSQVSVGQEKIDTVEETPELKIIEPVIKNVVEIDEFPKLPEISHFDERFDLKSPESSLSESLNQDEIIEMTPEFNKTKSIIRRGDLMGNLDRSEYKSSSNYCKEVAVKPKIKIPKPEISILQENIEGPNFVDATPEYERCEANPLRQRKFPESDFLREIRKPKSENIPKAGEKPISDKFQMNFGELKDSVGSLKETNENKESTSNSKKILPAAGQSSNLPKSKPTKNKKKQPPKFILELSDSFIRDYDNVIKTPVETMEKKSKKKEDRKKMHGYECPCCKHYYDALNLSPKSRQARINLVSRHRTTEENGRSSSPEHFWTLEFPSSQQCRDRGYIKESDSAKELRLKGVK